MANTSRKANRITYERLNQALIALGFVRKQTKAFTAYRESGHGALIILPNMSADSDVGAPHLVTVRNTVAGKGIASPDKLQALLVRPFIERTVRMPRSKANRPYRVFLKPQKHSVPAHVQQLAYVEETSKKPGKKRYTASKGHTKKRISSASERLTP